MSRTDDLIKKPIADLVARRADVLRPASDRGPREYPLPVRGNARRFRADWAFRLPDGGHVFIEDDDDVRALHNVTKYWMWMEDQAIREDVHLIHLIGPGSRDLATFEGAKATQAIVRFHHHVVPVARWDDEQWPDALAEVLDRIVGGAGGDGEPEPLGPLRDDPAIGMWKDREDLRDSTAWVRALRRTEWERR